MIKFRHVFGEEEPGAFNFLPLLFAISLSGEGLKNSCEVLVLSPHPPAVVHPKLFFLLFSLQRFGCLHACPKHTRSVAQCFGLLPAQVERLNPHRASSTGAGLDDL